MRLHNFFRTTLSFYKLFTGPNESGRSMGVCNFGNFLPINVHMKMLEWKFMFFDKKIRSRQKSTIWNLLFTLPWRILLKLWTLSVTKDTTTAKAVSQLKCLEELKKFCHANEGSGRAFSTDLGHIFRSNIGIEFGVMLRRKEPHKPEFAYDIVHIHSLIIYTDLIEYNIVGDTKAPLLHFPFMSKLKAGGIITTGQYMNDQTFSNLQFRPLPKNSFHFHIDLSDTSGEKIPCICQYNSSCYDVQKNLQHSFLT